MKAFRILFFVLLAVLVVSTVTARAGGAGGSSSSSSRSSYSSSSYGSSSGSSSDGMMLWILFELVSSIFRFLVRTFGLGPTIIGIGLITLAIWLYDRWSKADQRRVVKIAYKAKDTKSKLPKAFRESNPNFDESKFFEKVSSAFLAIQTAWTEQKISKVRRWISDGVYQRFHVQFLMMQKLGQKNILSRVKILGLSIADIEESGIWSAITVRIEAVMNDAFICKSNPALNQESSEPFVEYWTFLRKNNKDSTSVEKDLYTSSECPSCGAVLPDDMGELSVCPHCNSVVNSGAFDWVLSEISQETDWAETSSLAREPGLRQSLQALSKRDKQFCAQVLEDKVSNAWLQVLLAQANNEPAQMRRFVSDKAFAALSPSAEPFLYNRLWLNHVSLITYTRRKGLDTIVVSVSTTSQKVALNKGKMLAIDKVAQTIQHALVLTRSPVAAAAKGNIFQHQCPACGGPIEDSLALDCRYCGSLFNAGSHEWVLDEIMTMAQYYQYFETLRKDLKLKVDPEAWDLMFDVKDMVINNFMVMVASDGVFAEEERLMAAKLTKRLGLDEANLDTLFAAARNGHISLRMPTEPAKRLKVIKMLRDAMEADGFSSDEERAVLAQAESLGA